MDFDIIPKVLTITGGTRYYHFDNFQTGSVVSSFGCFNDGPGALPGGCDEYQRGTRDIHVYGHPAAAAT